MYRGGPALPPMLVTVAGRVTVGEGFNLKAVLGGSDSGSRVGSLLFLLASGRRDGDGLGLDLCPGWVHQNRLFVMTIRCGLFSEKKQVKNAVSCLLPGRTKTIFLCRNKDWGRRSDA